MNSAPATAAAFDPALINLQARKPLGAQQSADATGQAAHKINTRHLRKVAMDFEAVFIGEMLRPMFDGTEPEGAFGGGPGEDVWKNMQIDEYGKAIAKNGGIGIADAVMAHLIRLQEAAAKTN